MTNSQEVGRQFDVVLSTLLERTHASRTTLRIDLPLLGFGVNDPAGEARRPEAKSLRGETSIDQRAVETVKWLDRERRPLIQNDLLTAEVPAPAALIEIYGARAQMLAPIIVGNELLGWVSVHNSNDPRNWGQADTAALAEAVEAIHAVLADVAG